MLWTPETYEQWFQTPEAQFSIERQAYLLQSVVADWPRRGTKLLEVGCGTGIFLKMLYQMGFDVTGLDSSPTMLKAARKQCNNDINLYLGNGELLPFSDNEFEYACLWSVLEYSDNHTELLTEAARVAEKGLLIGFLNKHSCHCTLDIKANTPLLQTVHLKSWGQMHKIIHRTIGFRPSLARSVLPGPLKTWHTNSALTEKVNTILYPPFVGAFSAARIDFVNIKPLTPLFSWNAEPEMS